MEDIQALQQELTRNVLLAQQGSSIAFQRVVKTTQNMVSSLALSVVRDVDASEDIAQKVYLSVWQQLAELKKPESFLPWMRQITRNIAANHLRDNKVSFRVNSEESEALIANQEDPNLSLEKALADKDLHNRVAMIVDTLPGGVRDIVIMYYREEQNAVQVAHLLDMNEANVRKILSRVRHKIREELLSQCGDALLSTVPTAGFSALVTSGLLTSSPATAATSGISSGSSILGKVLSLLGGAIIGVFTAIMAVLWAAKKTQACISDEQERKILKRKTAQQVGWIGFSALALTAAYHMDAGWILPTGVYCIFILGLSIQVWQIHRLFQSGAISLAVDRRSYMMGRLGLLMGVLCGFSGLFAGMILSGRLIL